MNEDALFALKYPIGKLKLPKGITKEHIEKWILNLKTYPAKLENLVAGLDQEQLDTPYRPEGWTVRQLLHHIPDSHTNAYIRFKWALTEDNPLIKAYHEDLWGALPDSKLGAIKAAMDLLYALHARWVLLMENMADSDWEKTFIHPETNKVLSLKLLLALYNWHADHHYAHIENLMQREGW